MSEKPPEPRFLGVPPATPAPAAPATAPERPVPPPPTATRKRDAEPAPAAEWDEDCSVCGAHGRTQPVFVAVRHSRYSETKAGLTSRMTITVHQIDPYGLRLCESCKAKSDGFRARWRLWRFVAFGALAVAGLLYFLVPGDLGIVLPLVCVAAAGVGGFASWWINGQLVDLLPLEYRETRHIVAYTSDARKFAAYLEKNARKSAAAADEYRRFRTPFE